MSAFRILNSSEEWSGETRIVLRISLPAITACVRSGDMSKAVIAIPVLWVTVCGSPGLHKRALEMIPLADLTRDLTSPDDIKWRGGGGRGLCSRRQEISVR